MYLYNEIFLLFESQLILAEIRKWLTNGVAVAGDRSSGSACNQLFSPYDLDIDNNGTLFITDSMNHRIIACKQVRPLVK